MIRWILVLGVLGALAAWWLTRPMPVDPALIEGVSGDAEQGALVFHAGGCASCHIAPGAEASDAPVLAGGLKIESPFGTFAVPNISPSEAGIGGWSTLDLANALQAGISPNGAHYFPAFPYTTYIRMTPQDVADLKAFMDSLPPSDARNQDHDLAFPFSIRRGVGLWKRLYLNPDWVMDTPAELDRGRYLVEALAHCGECHTPRDTFGGLEQSQWMSGAPNPAGRGTIPGLTPDHLDWSESDIAYYLESGFTPDYDSAGGEMADVVSNMARLTPQDRAAIAAYIKALPTP